MDKQYVVVIDSFCTGARKYWVSDRTVNLRRLARPVTLDAARVIAENVQARLGRSVIVTIEEVK